MTKEDLALKVSLVRRGVCAYDGFMREMEPRKCDCKFGITKERRSEKNGCAELRLVSSILEAMTPIEWKRVCKRIGFDDSLD